MHFIPLARAGDAFNSRRARLRIHSSVVVQLDLQPPILAIQADLRHTRMTGPPTPPPTSAIELEDAARASGAPDVAQTAAPQPADPTAPISVQPVAFAPNAYRQAFSTILNLAAHERYQELVDVAEFSDLNVRSSRRLHWSDLC